MSDYWFRGFQSWFFYQGRVLDLIKMKQDNIKDLLMHHEKDKVLEIYDDFEPIKTKIDISEGLLMHHEKDKNKLTHYI